MRIAMIAMLLAAGCAAEPRIACTTSEQCLTTQNCVEGTCVATMQSHPDARSPDEHDDAGASSCMPACAAGNFCTGTTCSACNVDDHCGASCAPCGLLAPYCNGSACVQCTGPSQCPLTAPCCVNNTCQLLGC